MAIGLAILVFENMPLFLSGWMFKSCLTSSGGQMKLVVDKWSSLRVRFGRYALGF